jgi:flagellar hook-associated protein FlgK
MISLTQYQRAYEASLKVVQTADEMLQELLQMKR